MTSTTKTGDALESKIRDYFEAEIAADRFWVKKECCKVLWKPKYFSRDRNADIVFDVSIEIYLPGESVFSSLVIIECKNYSDPVPVDDIEEFFAKVQQVAPANAKAVMASTASFQRGTREYAKSKGIGLLRYFSHNDCKWELKRSPSASAATLSLANARFVEDGLEFNKFVSPIFDLYLQSPSRVTNSLWGFIEDLIQYSDLPPNSIEKVVNTRTRHPNRVPFVEKDDMEAKAADLLSLFSYFGGEVNLEAIYTREHQRTGLIVRTGVKKDNKAGAVSGALGLIRFEPLVIEIYCQENPNRGREKFTLAHELSHYFLSHGDYLVREYCDESDFTIDRRTALEGADISRLEYQANFFASCLLMPRHHFLNEFHAASARFGIINRGFGALYVDTQPCNLQNLKLVTMALAKKFGVSKAAVRIRLATLGLLRESM